MMLLRIIPILGLAGLLLACSTSPSKQKGSIAGQYRCVYQGANTGGAFYKDDGPGGHIPRNIDAILEPVPKREILHRFANRPYSVLGKNYTPRTKIGNFVQEGIGSWYGRKFHGQKTASGERYDMYAMTAAHPTLPIPSYARVTNQTNSRQVIVRINDRGPFHKDRVIDLSFLAACRLGYAMAGSAALNIEAIVPGHPLLAGAVSPPNKAVPRETFDQVPLINQPTDGIFIQLGAFASYSNADSFRLKVAERLNQPLAHIHLHKSTGVVRVRMGPFPTKDAAIKEVERLTGEHQLTAVLVQ